MITDIVHVNEFEDKIKFGIHLVDFWAPWCGPCRMLSSVLEEISNLISIIKVNVDESNELSSRFNIQNIPLILLFKDGVVTDRKNGFMTKSAILKWLEECGISETDQNLHKEQKK
jgi:thioredoxin 1